MQLYPTSFNIHIIIIVAITITILVHIGRTNGTSDRHHHQQQQQRDHVSVGLYRDLDRLARLVDIAYCVETTGLRPPFSCANHCEDFPDVELVMV